MSLYNMLHGVNPLAGLLLKIIGDPDIPRFRDCYLDGDKIAVYTRTGGGNRDFYESPESCQDNYPEYFDDDEPPSGPWNEDIRALPGFLSDEDDDFDSTYATFYFAIPERFKPTVEAMRNLGREEKPADAWQRVMDDLKAGKDTPEIERAKAGIMPVMEKIAEALK